MPRSTLYSTRFRSDINVNTNYRYGPRFDSLSLSVLKLSRAPNADFLTPRNCRRQAFGLRSEKACQKQPRHIIDELIYRQLARTVVPVIDPVHHSEQRIRRDGQIYRRRSPHPLLNPAQNTAGESGLFLFRCRNPLVQITRQRFGLVRKHFHLGHVSGKKR